VCVCIARVVGTTFTLRGTGSALPPVMLVSPIRV
jgi:hypothetical protein